MKKHLPKPAIERLCILYRLCDDLRARAVQRVSSKVLGQLLGTGSYTIRKDINYLGEVGDIGSGYSPERLYNRIRFVLGLDKKRSACIVGLGRLGSAILAYERFADSGFSIVAGFDSNINKLETIRTTVELYPAYEIADIVRKKNIEIGVIAVPASAAQETADRLIEGGVRAIVNFSPALFSYDSSRIFVTHMDIIREFTILSAYMSLGNKDTDTQNERG